MKASFLTTPEIVPSSDKKWPWKLAVEAKIWVSCRAWSLRPVEIFDKSGRAWLIAQGDNRGCFFTLKAGYSFDGATGAPDSLSALTAALWHDAFYQFLDQLETIGFTRKHADDGFFYLLRSFGMNRLQARLYWLAVRVFGGFFAGKRK